MSGFVDRAEQYIDSGDNKILMWMFDGYGQADSVQRKVLILRLSPCEFEMFSSRGESKTVEDVFRQVYSTLSYPDVRVLMVYREPHYSAVDKNFTISSSMTFDEVVQEMGNLASATSLSESEEAHG